MKLKIFTDGGSRSNPGPAAIGVFVQDEHGTSLFQLGRPIGTETNNVAEYTALIVALEWVKTYASQHSVEQASFYLDSKLVVEQVQGHWKVKEPHLQTLCVQAKQLLSSLPCSTHISYVPRAENSVADGLVNQALDQGSEVLVS